MSASRISLRDVSVRFRMSYHRASSMPEIARELWLRASGRWEPEYFTALNGLSLEVANGEVVGVIGRNGAGKSTLLRTISGIYYPDAGEVNVQGTVSALLGLGIGFNTTLSGRENIILGGLTLGYSLAEIEERMEMVLEFADIGDFADVPMRYYSSGMMSRLSFSVVMSMEPDILLIDETLSVGDLSFRGKAREAMHKLLERASCQVIVSHSPATIRRLCTRAILIDRGRLLADGSPDEVIAEYEGLVKTREKDLPPGVAAELAEMQA